MSELDTTVFQFETVDAIEYRLEGDRQAWCDFLDGFECSLAERPRAGPSG